MTCLTLALTLLATSPATQGAPPPREDLGRTRPAVRDASPFELLALAVQTKREIEERLLTPDPELVDRAEALLGLDDTGICRLLHRDGVTGWETRMLRRGGGAYYSFATRDHSYDLEPDISYQHGDLASGFYGYTLGLLLDVGELDLVDLIPEDMRPPADLDRHKHEDWETLCGPITHEDSIHGSTFKESHRELLRDVPAVAGRTYLMRRYKSDEHDLLVAFTVLEMSDVDLTLAWRVLRRFETPGTSSRDMPWAYLDVPQGPMWLDGRSLEDLAEFLDEVQARAVEVLLEVPAEQRRRYEAIVGKPRRGLTDRGGFRRILRREIDLRALIKVPGYGHDITFADLEETPDPELGLRLNRGRFECLRRAGGAILDLGEVDPDELEDVMNGEAPKGLSKRELEAREFLMNVRAQVDENLERPVRSLTAEEREVMDELGLSSGRTSARVGHSYLLRTFLAPTHDHLVVFTVIGRDEFGLSLAYRVLSSWPVEVR